MLGEKASVSTVCCNSQKERVYSLGQSGECKAEEGRGGSFGGTTVGISGDWGRDFLKLHNSQLFTFPFHVFLFVLAYYHTAFGILVPQPGVEPVPLPWKHNILTTGPAGKSPHTFLGATFVANNCDSTLLLWNCDLTAFLKSRIKVVVYL